MDVIVSTQKGGCGIKRINSHKVFGTVSLAHSKQSKKLAKKKKTENANQDHKVQFYTHFLHCW